MLKLYEEFVNYDKLYDIIKQIENRLKYWFGNEGTLGKDTSLIDLNSTITDKYKTRSVIINFNNQNYMYQCILTVAADNGDKCHITLKRYGLDEQNLIDQIQEEVDLNDVKEDLIISKISELEEKKENPDENKIEVQKEKEPKDEENQEDFGDETQQGEENEEEPELGGGFDTFDEEMEEDEF